jgi:serine/threonine-protein kinase
MTDAAEQEDPTDDSDPVALGSRVAGKYIVDSRLGRGASGVVYSARPLDGTGRVALKIIHPELCHSRQIFGRYKREATILRRLKGDHIVGFLDFLEHDGLLVIVLEHVDGASLETMLSGRPLEVDVATDVAIQLCRGLESAHQASVIHRDLKPANVMIQRSEAGARPTLRARILDFGLAKVVHGEHMVTGLTERDMIFGTPEYMAPEQVRGDEVDARCDLYACGAILYEMVTGSVPFSGRTPLATMTAQLTEEIVPPRTRAPARDIPPALEAVIMHALQKDPGARFPSAEAMADALAAARERRIIALSDAPDGDLAARDTELALRRSQIKAAQPLLEEAEALAREKASSQPPVPAVDNRRISRPSRPDEPRRGWVWPVVAVVAIATCVVLGVVLALS